MLLLASDFFFVIKMSVVCALLVRSLCCLFSLASKISGHAKIWKRLHHPTAVGIAIRTTLFWNLEFRTTQVREFFTFIFIFLFFRFFFFVFFAHAEFDCSATSSVTVFAFFFTLAVYSVVFEIYISATACEQRLHLTENLKIDFILEHCLPAYMLGFIRLLVPLCLALVFFCTIGLSLSLSLSLFICYPHSRSPALPLSLSLRSLFNVWVSFMCRCYGCCCRCY